MPEPTTNAILLELWEAARPYLMTIIAGLFGLITAVLLAARVAVTNNAKRDTAKTDNITAQVKKEETFLALINDLRTEVIDAKQERVDDRSQIAALQAQLAQLQTDFSAAVKRENERERDFNKLVAERDSLKKELERIAAELEKLRTEIQRLIDERDALNKLLENERNLRREAELAQIQIEADLEKERSRLTSEISILQSKVALLEQNIALLNNPKPSKTNDPTT